MGKLNFQKWHGKGLTVMPNNKTEQSYCNKCYVKRVYWYFCNFYTQCYEIELRVGVHECKPSTREDEAGRS